MLSPEEMTKFAQWCRAHAADNDKMATLLTKNNMEAVAKKYRQEAIAMTIVAAILEATEVAST